MFPTACWYWLMYHLVHHSLSNQQGIQQGTALYGYHLLFLVPLLHSICPWCEATEFHSPELYNFPSRKKNTTEQQDSWERLPPSSTVRQSHPHVQIRLNGLTYWQDVKATSFTLPGGKGLSTHTQTDGHTHRHVCLTGLLNKRQCWQNTWQHCQQ